MTMRKAQLAVCTDEVRTTRKVVHLLISGTDIQSIVSDTPKVILWYRLAADANPAKNDDVRPRAANDRIDTRLQCLED